MYHLIKNTLTSEINTVFSMDKSVFIPFDPANTDFIEYKKWLAEGNEPEPADAQGEQ